MSGDDWLAQARRRADVLPVRPRLALYVTGPAGQHRIGSVEPKLVERMAAAGLPIRTTNEGFCIGSPADEVLLAIARWLHAERVASHWRSELLAVTDEEGRAVAAIERGVVRALGLATEAVHLVGYTAGGATWVQLRAASKSTDPGLWDTLMGGQVSAGESVEATLRRETSEEAGLRIDDLQQLVRCAPVVVRRPVREGYMVERIEVFRAIVPDGLVPANRDGEVERFDRLDDEELLERLRSGVFTLEATLVLGAELEGRGALGDV